MLKFKEFFKNYRWAIAIFLAFAVIIVYFKIFRVQRPDWIEHPKVVETEIIKKSVFKHQINLIGTIRPKNYCVLTAKTGGTIDTLISPGTSIKKAT